MRINTIAKKIKANPKYWTPVTFFCLAPIQPNESSRILQIICPNKQIITTRPVPIIGTKYDIPKTKNDPSIPPIQIHFGLSLPIANRI